MITSQFIKSKIDNFDNFVWKYKKNLLSFLWMSMVFWPMVLIRRWIWIYFQRGLIRLNLDNLRDFPNLNLIDYHLDKAKMKKNLMRINEGIERFTLRSFGNRGNFANDCKPTLIIDRTRRLQNSSVKPSIEWQREQLSKTNSLIY